MDAFIEKVAGALRKRFKTATFGDAPEFLHGRLDFMPTGSLALDRICAGTNPGGIPLGPTQGRIVHIAGEWSTGKSLLLDHLACEVVRKDGYVLITEAEGTRTDYFIRNILSRWALALPASKREAQIQKWLERIMVHYPETIEESFDLAMAWNDETRKDKPSTLMLWGIDSLDASEAGKTAKVELSKSGAWHYGGGKGEALGAGLRHFVRCCVAGPTTLVMLNQTREDPSVMYGSKKYTPGGNPPHFYASLEVMLSPLKLTRGPQVKWKIPEEVRKSWVFPKMGQGDVVGAWVRATITKTKIAGHTIRRFADFYWDMSRGVLPWHGLVRELVKEGRMHYAQSGSIDFHYRGTTLSFDSEVAWAQWAAAHFDALAYEPAGEARVTESDESEHGDESA